MSRHCHEGAEEALQGLTMLLLPECEPVSDGGQGLSWGEDRFECCHLEAIIGGCGVEVPGEALVNLWRKGAGQ